MKPPKEQAEELVEKYLPIVRGADRYNYNLEDMNIFIAKQCAIEAVEHTIEVLQEVAEKGKVDLCGEFAYQENVLIAINEQTEILTKLKAKL